MIEKKKKHWIFHEPIKSETNLYIKFAHKA